MFLIIGGDAEIGAATVDHLGRSGYVVSATTRRPYRVSPDRPFLDLSQPLDAWEPPAGTRAACVVSAVARLADCAADPKGSAYINVTQTIALCEQLIARGIYVLFLSTNQVFDGNTPHVAASASTNPVSEYGRQKAFTEALLESHISNGANVAILRFARVISPEMTLVRSWNEDLRLKKKIYAFHDMMLAPVPIHIATAAVAQLLKNRVSGIFQLSGPQDVSYLQLAQYLTQQLSTESDLVESISARVAGLPIGSTPGNTTLDSSRLRTSYGIVVPGPWQVLGEIVNRHQSDVRHV
jgi:dTDP-4-dehydrorhamnose reductase